MGYVRSCRPEVYQNLKLNLKLQSVLEYWFNMKESITCTTWKQHRSLKILPFDHRWEWVCCKSHIYVCGERGPFPQWGWQGDPRWGGAWGRGGHGPVWWKSGLLRKRYRNLGRLGIRKLYINLRVATLGIIIFYYHIIFLERWKLSIQTRNNYPLQYRTLPTILGINRNEGVWLWLTLLGLWGFVFIWCRLLWLLLLFTLNLLISIHKNSYTGYIQYKSTSTIKLYIYDFFELWKFHRVQFSHVEDCISCSSTV